MRTLTKRFGVMTVLAAVMSLVFSFGLAGTAGAEEIKIGFHAPLTGPLAGVGKDAREGAELAVKLINEAGGISGKKINLIIYDDRMKTTEAITLARKFKGQDKVVAVVSGSLSGMTRAAAPVYQAQKLPYVAAYATHPSIAPAGNYVFQNSINAVVQGKAAAHLIAKILKAKKVAVMAVDIEYGRTLAKAFKEEGKKLGLEVVSEHVYPIREKDFRPILAKIKGGNQDVIYTTGYPVDATRTIKQAAELGVKTPIVGTETLDHPDIIFPLAGKAAEGILATTAINRDDKRPEVQTFLKRYNKEWKRPASMVAASAYDAVVILADAVKRAGSNDAEAIVKALAGMKNLNSAVTGPLFRFDAQGRVIKPVYVQQVKNQQFRGFAIIDDMGVITPPPYMQK